VVQLAPLAWHAWKLPAEFAVILALIILNIRGVRESVAPLVSGFPALSRHACGTGSGRDRFPLGQAPRVAGEVWRGSPAVCPLRSLGPVHDF